MEISTGKPYIQFVRGNVKFRMFSEDVKEHELIWHKDEEDRLIKVITGEGWQFQFENEMPFEMKPGMLFHVPKETYHRIIKGLDILRIKIYE